MDLPDSSSHPETTLSRREVMLLSGQNKDRRSDERKQAESMFLASGGDVKLVDIAERLRLPAAKIRKWKSLDKWDEKLRSPGKKKTSGAFHREKVERSTQKRCAEREQECA